MVLSNNVIILKNDELVKKMFWLYFSRTESWACTGSEKAPEEYRAFNCALV